MPRQILFVQGAGEAVHDTWDDKLVRSLERTLGPGYAIRYPRMPREAQPRYAVWKATLLIEFQQLEDGAILIGHSVGGAVLLNVLAEEPLSFRPGALCIVAAPFVGEGGWRSDEIPLRTDLAARLPAGAPVFLYHGTDDAIVPFAHLQLYAGAMPRAETRALAQRDHQLNNDLAEVARDIFSLPLR